MEAAERRLRHTSKSGSTGQSANDQDRLQSEDDTRQAELDRWWADWTDDLQKIGPAETDQSPKVDDDCEGQIPTADALTDQQEYRSGTVAGPSEVVKTKLCPGCGVVKTYTDYYKHPSNWNNITSECKLCINAKRRTTYRSDTQSNRKKSREYSRQRSARLRGRPTKPPVQGQLYVDPAELEWEM